MERHEAQILSQGADEINTESQMCGVSVWWDHPVVEGSGRQKREETWMRYMCWGVEIPIISVYNRDGMGMVINPIVGVDKPIIYEDFL